MKKLKIFLILNILIVINMETVAQETEWAIDSAHSNISFSISHFIIATVKGSFDTFEGTLSSDGEDFSNSQLVITIKGKSINTNQTDRDNHLRSKGFLDIEKNPELRFQSKRFERIGEKEYKAYGTFTMNGISKELVINATYKGSFEHPQLRKTIAVFEINADIPRLEFKVGVDYPAAALGETVKLISTIELTKM